MSWLMDMTLLRPIWLILLPALVVVAILLRRRVAGLGDWPKVIDPALMDALQALGRVDVGGRREPHLLGVAAAGIIVLALSGPASERRDAAAFRNMDGVIFVIDSSASVFEDGHWPALQTMGRFGIAALGSRPAAMVLFAGDAYVAADLTADTRQLGLTLSLIDQDTVPDPGSRLLLGLTRAFEIFDGANLLGADVVVMSDGVDPGSEAIRTVAEIAQKGGRVSVVAPTISPQAQTLATTGNGRTFELTQIDEFAGYLRDGAPTQLERQDYPLLYWSDFGRYVLLLALIPVAFFFRRRAG